MDNKRNNRMILKDGSELDDVKFNIRFSFDGGYEIEIGGNDGRGRLVKVVDVKDLSSIIVGDDLVRVKFMLVEMSREMGLG